MRPISSGLLLLALAAPASAEQTQSDLKLVVARYVEAQEAVMEKDAGPAQVAELLAFYTPDFVYHHPAVGAKVTGSILSDAGFPRTWGGRAMRRLSSKAS